MLTYLVFFGVIYVVIAIIALAKWIKQKIEKL